MRQAGCRTATARCWSWRSGTASAEPTSPRLSDVSTGAANTIASRLRDTIERSLGALLVARRARNSGGCEELAAILDGWDGQLNVLMRKRISRHIESCGRLRRAASTAGHPRRTARCCAGVRPGAGVAARTDPRRGRADVGLEADRPTRPRRFTRCQKFPVAGGVVRRRIDRRRGIGLHLAQPEGHRHHAHGRQRDDIDHNGATARSRRTTTVAPHRRENRCAAADSADPGGRAATRASIDTTANFGADSRGSVGRNPRLLRTAARVRTHRRRPGRIGCPRCCLPRPRREAAPHRR